MWQNAMLLKLGCSKKDSHTRQILYLNPQLLFTSNSSSTNHVAETWLLQAGSRCNEGNLLKCKANIRLGEKSLTKVSLIVARPYVFHNLLLLLLPSSTGIFFFFFMISTISSNYREGSLKKNIQ